MSNTQYKQLSGQASGWCSSLVLVTIAYWTVVLLSFFAWQYYAGNNVPCNIMVSNDPGKTLYPPPPPHDQYAKVARYLMHISDWASLATKSTHDTIEGYPFANVFSISDGVNRNSSGTPYFYLTPMELSVKDLQKDPRVSLTASLAQSSYCHQQSLDPQDPRCAHVILTGEIVKLKAKSPEALFAEAALFERHPEMSQWPKDHDWFFARLAIRHIYLLDYFGGAKVITPEAYYAADPTAQ